MDQHGTDFWWSLPISDLIPTEILKENNVTLEEIEKGQVNNIVDFVKKKTMIILFYRIFWTFGLTVVCHGAVY